MCGYWKFLTGKSKILITFNSLLSIMLIMLIILSVINLFFNNYMDDKFIRISILISLGLEVLIVVLSIILICKVGYYNEFDRKMYPRVLGTMIVSIIIYLGFSSAGNLLYIINFPNLMTQFVFITFILYLVFNGVILSGIVTVGVLYLVKKYNSERKKNFLLYGSV